MSFHSTRNTVSVATVLWRAITAMVLFAIAPLALAQQVLSPATISFGNVPLTVPVTQTGTFTNNSTFQPVTITALSTSDARFVAVGSGVSPCNVGAVLTFGANCTYALTFTPTGTGAFNNTTTVAYNLVATPQTPLTQTSSGTGITPPSTVSPPSILFGNVPPTVISNQTFTFTNNSNTTSFPAPYTLASIGTVGLGFFAVGIGATPCSVGLVLAPTASCQVQASFQISGTGSSNGTTTIGFQTGQGANPVYNTSVALNGVGFAPPYTNTPSSLNFGNVVVNVAAPLSYNFTNNSDTTLFPSPYTLTSLSTAGLGYTAVGSGATPCAVSLVLPPGASCGVTVTFQIAVTGSSGGSTTIGFLAGLGTDPPYTSVMALSGTGVAAPPPPTMTVAFSPSTVVAGTPSTLVVTITNPALVSTTLGGSSVGTTAPLNISGGVTNTCALSGGVTGNTYSFGMSTITPSGTCTINIPVLSSTAGSFVVNVVPGNLVSTPTGNNTNSSSATLVVTPALTPTMTVTFAPTSVSTNTNATLTLTLSNPLAAPAAMSIGGSVSMPPGLNLSGLVDGCGASAAVIVSTVTTINLGMGGTIPPFGSCTITAQAQSALPGSFPVTVSPGNLITALGNNANTSTATLVVGGVPAISLTPTSVAFGARTVSTTSPSTTVTLGNPGTALLTITSITATGDFGFITSCPISPASLAISLACPINITFTPLTATAITGSITIVSNAPGSPHTITLTGAGTALPVPGISLAPASLAFAAWAVNTSSATQNIVVTNTGFANLTLGAISIGAPFSRVALVPAVPPDCATSVAPSSSCQIGVIFTPVAAGSFTGLVSIIDNATGSPHTVTLTGTGTSLPVPVINVNGTLPFGDQVINSGSNAQSLTIANTGAATLSISAITISGTHAANFTLSGQSACASIAPTSSCTLTVTFAATTTGAKAAQINITSNAQNAALVNTVSLTANGILAPRPLVNVTSTAIGYGNVIFGGATPYQGITLTNSGGQSMNIVSIVAVGDFVQMNNCGSTLAPLASCTISIVFTPLLQGNRFGELILTTNAATSPDRIPLSGTGCRWFSHAQSRFFLTSCGL